MNPRIYQAAAPTDNSAPEDELNELHRPAAHPINSEDQTPPFPLDCLPPAAAAMARAICELERTPASLAGVCTLAFLSASIGRGLQVKSGPERCTRGNLYLVASAESGSGKSETFRHSARPFFDFEAELISSWRTSVLPGWQAEREVLEEEVVRLKKAAGKTTESGVRAQCKAQLEQKKSGACTNWRPGSRSRFSAWTT